jgi:hypothetical protein
MAVNYVRTQISEEKKQTMQNYFFFFYTAYTRRLNIRKFDFVETLSSSSP